MYNLTGFLFMIMKMTVKKIVKGNNDDDDDNGDDTDDHDIDNEDHISFEGNRTRYRFIKLDMSTGLDKQSTSGNRIRYADTELEASPSIDLCELKDSYFPRGQRKKSYRAR